MVWAPGAQCESGIHSGDSSFAHVPTALHRTALLLCGEIVRKESGTCQEVPKLATCQIDVSLNLCIQMSTEDLGKGGACGPIRATPDKTGDKDKKPRTVRRQGWNAKT